MKKHAILFSKNSNEILKLASYLESNSWSILTAGDTARILTVEGIHYTYEPALEDESVSSDEKLNLLNQIQKSSYEKEFNSDLNNNSKNIFLVAIDFPVQEVSKPKHKNINSEKNTSDFFLSEVIRCAFKNYKNVLVLTDSNDYEEALIQLKTENITNEFRKYLAAKAMNMISAFDSVAADFFYQSLQNPPLFKNYAMFPLKKYYELHNGSNSHQKAYIYSLGSEFENSDFKESIKNFNIDYNTVRDMSLACDVINMIYNILKHQFSVKTVNSDGYEFTTQFTPLTGTVFTISIKNGFILGSSLATNAADSFENTLAYDTDYIRFAVAGCSSVIDKNAAQKLSGKGISYVIAPDCTEDAVEILNQNKISILKAALETKQDFGGSLINGGLVLQTKDSSLFNKWTIHTKLRPNQAQVDAMAFGTITTMNAKSNCMLLVKENSSSIASIAQGAVTQKKAADLLCADFYEYKARLEHKGISENSNEFQYVLVSDSTIPFTGSIKNLIELGVIKAILMTSPENNETTEGNQSNFMELVNFCNEKNVILVTTDQTHLNF